MPRRPRLIVPGIPLHIIQRGNNRQVCFFFADEDYLFYLDWLYLVGEIIMGRLTAITLSVFLSVFSVTSAQAFNVTVNSVSRSVSWQWDEFNGNAGQISESNDTSGYWSESVGKAGQTSDVWASGNYSVYGIDAVLGASGYGPDFEYANTRLSVSFTVDEGVFFNFDIENCANIIISGGGLSGNICDDSFADRSGYIEAGTYSIISRATGGSGYTDENYNWITDSDRNDFALRLTKTAVPAPAAVWLFGSALAGLGWMRRKQTV
jgi:hypothetical protein